ncbi:hypothetical protein [Actinoplanes sp. NPDC089786]|uniref:DUF4760 domain-containing protein n=1 Tax=Actinoplanes sp. NPDC089786 TaxID=3155185 RepID=UPI00343F805F
MDTDAVLDLFAVVVAVVALSVTALLAIRQMRTSAAGYALPVVLQMFDQFRGEEFFAAREYVLDVLAKEFDPPLPFRDLPPEVRSQVRMVAGRYDDLGKLVAHRVVDPELVIGGNGTAIRQVWAAVAPFVRQERAVYGTTTWIYLEDLANRAQAMPPRDIYAKLGLQHSAEL